MRGPGPDPAHGGLNLLAKELVKEKVEEKEDIKPRETPPEFIASMANVLVIGLFIITFCLQSFVIPSSSMENTLLIGDHLFVDRVTNAPPTKWIEPIIPYRDIKRGQIIVFISPAQPGLYLVKRVVGVPGDRIHLENGVVYLNGVAQHPAYVIRSGNPDFDAYRDDFPNALQTSGATFDWRITMPQYIQGNDLVVPPNSYFAMGDNRDVSFDSRYWGFVPRENIIGRPMVVYWSFKTPREEYEKTDMIDRVKYIGTIVVHFFDRTRWNRMFRLVH